MRTKFKISFFALFLLLGCSKDDKCRDVMEFPCYDWTTTESSIVGTYGCKDICILERIGTYKCQGYRTGISRTDPDGGNLSIVGYYGTIRFKPNFTNHFNPSIGIHTPIIQPSEGKVLTINEEINERIQHFNSRTQWKLGDRQTNLNDEYLAVSISFDCRELESTFNPYSIFFDTKDELLEADSYVKIEKFEMDTKDGEIHYDITFDINTHLYVPNCIRNCRREKLDVTWNAKFSVPVK